MTTATYYKTTLILPVAVPLLTFGEEYLRGESQGGFYFFACFLLASVVLGGIPYLYIVFRLGREIAYATSPEEVQRLIEGAPVRMLPACAVCWMAVAVACGAVYGILGEGISAFLIAIAWGIGGTLVLSLFVMLFGYAYVFLAKLGLEALRAFHIVAD